MYRKLLKRTIDAAIAECDDAVELEHRGLIGQVRELAAERIIKPMLPAGFEVATGKVTDPHGTLSDQMDLVIHSRGMLPPVMHSARDGVIAAHSTYYAIEVKSQLTAKTLKEAMQNALSLRRLDFTAPGDPERNGCVPVLFAFDSDLGRGSSDLDRYVRYEAETEEGAAGVPILSAICVVGRGYFFRTKSGQWSITPANDERDEVIDFIAGLANTLIDWRNKREPVPLGRYLIAP